MRGGDRRALEHRKEIEKRRGEQPGAGAAGLASSYAPNVDGIISNAVITTFHDAISIQCMIGSAPVAIGMDQSRKHTW